MLEYNRKLKEASCSLRNNMTEAEQLLWSRLRRKQLLGVQFYRQKPIGNFIVDFYAPAVSLVIEVDGCQHLEPEHWQQDKIRDQYLVERGLVVLRFDNRQVLREGDAVVEKILCWMRERLNPP
jgi:very-short-patch-repair endonuclease